MPHSSLFSRGTKRVWKLALDLIFPIFCQGCGREGLWLCLSCQAKISTPETRCLTCGKPSFLGRTHAECRTRDQALDGLLVAADYQNEGIRNLIWNLKYNSVDSISEVLVTLMIDYLVKNDLLEYFSRATIIPVPLAKRRVRERGFNQAGLLAQNLAEKLHLEYLPILEKIKHSKRQVDLSREERVQNVVGHFRASILPSLGEQKILLIDDVATTGATLNECAKVLREQQVSEIWGFVVARN